jgi:hypothetical protein
MSDLHQPVAHGQEWPRWLSDISRLLPIKSQFVISGNIRDSFLVPGSDGGTAELLTISDAIWRLLSTRQFNLMAVFDRTDGYTVVASSQADREGSEKLLGEKPPESGLKKMSKQRFGEIARVAAVTRDHRIACVVDYASRLTPSSEQLPDADYEFFAACEKAANIAVPVYIKGQQGVPYYNPLIWLANRPNDLPSWLTLDNERIDSIIIPLPDYMMRKAAALLLGAQFSGFSGVEQTIQEKFADQFATFTEGMTLTSMMAIAQLAREARISASDVDDAVRSYKLGITDSPWKKQYLQDKVRTAGSFIADRVKGQPRAINAVVNILVRSIMGMTGAQAPSTSGRPRGVMFFAGPTGVGKTELAKALTSMLFGDDRAYIRFDMSEFSQEHSDARLLGAPPGYVGYDAGGELTRSVREKPFSVILFDEIEKAHPRILDKFLQILEDGRLTDGRGETVYFSETVIIFTSNLGIYIADDTGKRFQNVKPGDSYEEVDQRIRDAISSHFKFNLNRPEILNRIGDNIVVFNFITPESAAEIFAKMLDNVVRTVYEEHGFSVVLQDHVRMQLRERCTADLSNGGRGIGNRLESLFINPLARALFEKGIAKGQTVTVVELLERDDGIWVGLA